MERKKNMVILSHCILNQNSVVLPLARAKGAYNAIIKTILNRDIGIIQLPCPEIIHLGTKRPSMTKEEYDTKDYRQLCKELLQPIISQILFYKDENYKIIGLVGIDKSPTCRLNNNGILMDVLFKLLEVNQIKLNKIDVPTTYHEENNIMFSKVFSQWIDDSLNH